MVPETLRQLTILLLFALPGVVYQVTRDQLLGPVAAEQETENRLLRAVAVSVILDALYATVAGPALADLMGGEDRHGLDGLGAHTRLAGAIGLLLLVVIPAALAITETSLSRRRRAAAYEPTPTAWDHLFRDQGGCFIRVRLQDGTWIGGWYGHGANAAAFPHPKDLFLSAQYAMRPDGHFDARMPGTGGVYISADSISFMEILNAPVPPPA